MGQVQTEEKVGSGHYNDNKTKSNTTNKDIDILVTFHDAVLVRKIY